MNEPWETLLDYQVLSQPGSEREVMERVAAAARPYLGGPLDRLKTAVSEGTLNAMEHGNQGRAELPVRIEMLVSDRAVMVRITDQGGGKLIPEATAPDIEAKLAGLEKPRGWGLFLIRSMVDEVHMSSNEQHHTLEMVFYREKNG